MANKSAMYVGSSLLRGAPLPRRGPIISWLVVLAFGDNCRVHRCDPRGATRTTIRSGSPRPLHARRATPDNFDLLPKAAWTEVAVR